MESVKAYILLALAWSVYLALHSLMASSSWKGKAYRIGFTKRSYRLFYSVFSTILLFGLLLYNGMIDGEYLVTRSTLTKYVGLFLAGGGVFVLRAAFKQYSFSRFVGLSSEDDQPKLQVNGILNHVRHPIYSATILITLGYLFFDPRLPSLVSVLCVWIYLPIGIYFEEKKLIEEWGDKYLEYKKQVPSVLPTFWRS